MAHGRPWYKRYPADFIMGTASLDLEARGAYSLILDLLNERDRPIPDEPRFLAGVLNCSVRKWNGIRQTLLDAEKIVLNHRGEITNPRFERERVKRADDHEKAVDFGRIGGRKSAEMRHQTELFSEKNAPKVKDKSDEPDAATNEINDIAEGSPQPIPEAESRRRVRDSLSTAASSDSRATDFVALSDHLCRIGGVRNIDPGRIVANCDQVRHWTKAGATPAMLAEVIQSRRERATDGIHSLRYFDAAIRQAIARKDYPDDKSTIDHIRDPLLRDYLARTGSMEKRSGSG